METPPEPKSVTKHHMNATDQKHFEQWMAATRHYLFMDLENSAHAGESLLEGWSPPRAESQGGRKKFLARVRGRVLRLAVRDDGDCLHELEKIFFRQVSFVVSHPDVPRRLLSWLMQCENRSLGRRVRRVIDHYVLYLARIIAHAKLQGRVRPDIQPRSAANLLVGAIQALGLRAHAAPQPRELLLREAAEVFALFRAQLACENSPICSAKARV